MINFIKKLTKNSKNKLIITTGYDLPNILKKIKPKLIELKVHLHEGLDFSQLKKITLQWKWSCLKDVKFKLN